METGALIYHATAQSFTVDSTRVDPSTENVLIQDEGTRLLAVGGFYFLRVG